MSKIIDMFVQYLWETWIRPILNRLDRWDRGFIAILFLIACIQWAVFWRGQSTVFSWLSPFNNIEKVLWISLLPVSLLGWFFTRKIINFFHVQYKNLNARTIAVITISFVFAFSFWLYGAYAVYKIPVFGKNDVGLFIARFTGDLNDEGQLRIFRSAKDAIDLVPTLNDKYKIKTSILPRRVRSHSQAKKYGNKGLASLVIWGQIYDFTKLKALLNATFVNMSTLVEKNKEAGTLFFLDSSSVNDLPVDNLSDNYIKALLLFLAGYESYFSREYGKACEKLKNAKQNLPEKDKFGISSDEILLGNVNFYLANTYIGCVKSTYTESCMSRCEITSEAHAYENSLSLYSKAAQNLSENNKIWDSYYVEALNNLAFFMCNPSYVKGLNANNDSDLFKHCNPENAQKIIEQAYEGCNRGRQISFLSNSMSCAYIAYNLGTLIQNNRKYADAIMYFQEAITNFRKAETVGDINEYGIDYWFLAQAHQALAYNYAKTAENSNDTVFMLEQIENSEKTMKSIALKSLRGYFLRLKILF